MDNAYAAARLRLGLKVPFSWNLTLTHWDGEQFLVKVGVYYDDSKKFVHIDYVGKHPDHVQEMHIGLRRPGGPYSVAGEYVPVDWLIQRLEQV